MLADRTQAHAAETLGVTRQVMSQLLGKLRRRHECNVLNRQFAEIVADSDGPALESGEPAWETELPVQTRS
jgi:hypothetical protein